MKLTKAQLKRLIKEECQKALNELDMERLLNTKYEVFVKYLGKNISDPKVLAMIDAGQKDGDPSDDRFAFQQGSIAVQQLRPTQMEVDIDKSLKFPMSIKPTEFIKFLTQDGPFTLKGPIVTYNGKYVIDGHHRWSSLYSCNKDAIITNIDMQIQGLEPLDALKAVQAAIGTEVGRIPMQSVKGSNLFKMNQGDIKSWIEQTISADGGAEAPLVQLILKSPAALAKIKAAAGKGAEATPSPEGQVMSEQGQMQQAMEVKAIISEYLPAYIWSNISKLQQASQPVSGAPKRDFMPQTDDVNWTEPLAAGDIDIVPPHGPGTEKAAKKVAAESKTYARWKELIKG